METFNLPKYSKVIYSLNPESKYYTKTQIEAQETPINRLPLELRLAPVGAAQIKPNADTMLLSRLVNGKYSFRTGLQQTLFKEWQLGNDYEFYKGQKVISLLLIRFRDSRSTMEVYYFYRYDKPRTDLRMWFANGIIPHLLKRSTEVEKT